jgi:hypothetical protein
MLGRRRRRTSWTASPEALELLTSQGGPFDSAAFRRCWVECFPEWRDASFGAERADGTRAAVALLARGREVADSIPTAYGGVVTSRKVAVLHEFEAFLDAARKEIGVRSLLVRTVPVRPGVGTSHVGAAVRGWTSVVQLVKGQSTEARYAQKARRSIRRAQRASAQVVITDDADAFVTLYRVGAAKHWLRYPDELLRGLAREGAARFYDVRIAGESVSSVLVLASASHWTTWLAAQNETGREINGNYLAVAAVLEDAQRSGTRAVDLGVSHGLPPGVLHFKERFDAVLVPILEHRATAPGAGLADRAKLRSRRILRPLRRVSGR